MLESSRMRISEAYLHDEYFFHLPVWTRQWSFIWCRSLKAFPQNSHLNGLSPVCTGKCVINEDTSGKLLPQNLHSTTPPVPLAPPSPCELLVPGLFPKGFSRSIGELSEGSSESNPCRLAKWDGGGRSCGKNPSWGPSRCDTWSRYFSVSRECDRMCLVNLLWWGNDWPQYIHGYIGPLLLLLTLLFCSLDDEDDIGRPTLSPCTSVDGSCNQTKRKTVNFFCDWGILSIIFNYFVVWMNKRVKIKYF